MQIYINLPFVSARQGPLTDVSLYHIHLFQLLTSHLVPCDSLVQRQFAAVVADDDDVVFAAVVIVAVDGAAVVEVLAVAAVA